MIEEKNTVKEQQQVLSVAETIKQDESKPVGSGMEGFGKALASACMGFAGLILMFHFSMSVVAELLCMYGLILGVRAIGDYRTLKRLQTKKTIVPLVLGIIGTTLNAICCITWFVWILGYFIL